MLTLGLSIGYLTSEAFSDFDEAVKYKGEWYKKQSHLTRWLIDKLLNITHHFQYGLVLYIAALLNLPDPDDPLGLLIKTVG